MPIWLWPEGSSTPAWPSTTATTVTTPTWVRWSTATWATTADSGTLYWAANSQQEYAAMRAQQLYQHQQASAYTQALSPFQTSSTGLWLGSLFTPPIARPALVTHQENAHRDRELYHRAIEEHDEQEAARLLRLVERHEMLAADERRAAEERQQRHAEETQRRERAKARARELLFEHLTPAQRETFDVNGWFVVEGGKSKTQYRIRAVESMVANVDVLNGRGGRSYRLCAHARLGSVPLGDQLLAQKIMIELAEDDFLRIANRHAA